MAARYGSPPPSYRTDTETVTSLAARVASNPPMNSSREDTPLLPGRTHKYRYHVAWTGMLAFCCILVSVMLATITFQMSTNWQRASWNREILQHNKQRVRMDQERLAWLEESKKFVNDSMQMELERMHWGQERERWQIQRERWDEEKRQRDARWDRERRTWQIERERWAEEQRQRDEHKPFFGAPRRSSERCLTYGTREYTAKLYNILTTEDWGAKCSNTAINIKGRIHEHPTRCENHGADEGVYGYWTIDYDELECQPSWEKFWRGDCDHIPGHRRWESVLYNVRSGEADSDMYEICRSTPVTLPSGDYFATTKCEDRRYWGPNDWRGWYGKWDAPDASCNN